MAVGWAWLACEVGRLTDLERQCQKPASQPWRVQALALKVRRGYPLCVRNQGYCGVDKAVVVAALRALPEQMGTAKDVHHQIQRTYAGTGRLDETIASSTKSVPRWRNITSMILASSSHLFTRSKPAGKRIVYRLRDDIGTSFDRPRKRRRESSQEWKHAMNKVRAFGAAAGR